MLKWHSLISLAVAEIQRVVARYVVSNSALE
jgi:hypothetical protein